jgi:hypothetical protein
MVLWWNRFWTMYMTLMFLWWLFFVNSEATLSVIAGPTGSGQSMFVRWFVHNMTPKPDRILRCYGEYQTLYETVKGIEFQQGLPDLDNLDPREKHLIILDDLPSDKHRLSTACWSGNHTGKRMYPWHEMIGIVSVWNPPKKRIIGFQNIIGFSFITLWVLLLPMVFSITFAFSLWYLY